MVTRRIQWGRPAWVRWLFLALGVVGVQVGISYLLLVGVAILGAAWDDDSQRASLGGWWGRPIWLRYLFATAPLLTFSLAFGVGFQLATSVDDSISGQILVNALFWSVILLPALALAWRPRRKNSRNT